MIRARRTDLELVVDETHHGEGSVTTVEKVGRYTIRLKRTHKGGNQDVRKDTLDGLAVLFRFPGSVVSLDTMEFPTSVRKVLEVTGSGGSTLLGDGEVDVLHVVGLHVCR